ncbi:MAG TPA: DUF3052 domain-containing protein [Myxococcaceae bacterium]|nr:DUF3052 domain-containing protein [Myxococcaceae bacterium]
MSSPLSETLGIRAGSRIAVIEPPPGLAEALEPLPEGVERLTEAETALDLLLFFTHDARHLVSRMPALVRALSLSGRLWIAWRPGTAPPLDEVLVRQAGLEHGLVDDRRADVLPGWTGLRLRWRSRPRVERPSPRA